MQRNEYGYGINDNSFQAAGGEDGIRKLVECFYDVMDELPESQRIRDMHPDDLAISRKKLAYFLSGWLGGPRLYQEHFGSISIPGVHSHLDIKAEERDAWLLCMKKAIEQQPYAASFKTYLLEQLSIPAERIRMVCEKINHRD